MRNSLFSSFWLPAATFLAGTILSATVPTDNPIESYYAGDPHLSDYDWVDELAWENVHNILDFGAVADGNDAGDGIGVTDNSAAFHAAVDAAYEDGGGVVYIPAGTYYFGDHIYLKSGVVVRGATPANTDAQSAAFAPPTKLEFPKYFFDKTANGGSGNPNSSAFKFIYVDDNGYASHLGLVWLDINRAGISMSADGDGTENRLVFGTRTNNVASPDTSVPDLTYPIDNVETPFQHAWQRHSWRFVRNIHVFGQRNVLVANNRCNDKHFAVDHQLTGWESIEVDDFLQVDYIVRDSKRVFGSNSKAFIPLQAEHLPWFSYTNHYGIYVRGSSGSVWGAAPYDNPRLFRTGTTVRDNWVYTTMRVGYHVSGWGLKVLNNIKEDLDNKIWWLHPTGRTTLSGANTLENRGLDISGSNILVDGNTLDVERHKVNNGPYLSTDGEGILVQECCGGTTLDDVVISNNSVDSYIGIYKMPYSRDITITGNTMSEAGYILVNANKNGTQAPVFGIEIHDNAFTNSGGIQVYGTSGGNENSIQNNTLNGGDIRYPDGITTLSGNTGYGSLVQDAVGDVRDYPILELDDPSTGGILAPGETTVSARVTGSLVNPAPANTGELPDIVLVEIYANDELLDSFTSNAADPGSTAWLYETTWFPAPGYYQLSAKAVPAGYSGPYTSTEWFTVSDVIPLNVTGGSVDDLYAAWLELHFPGETDPAIIGDFADTDMDGLALLVEFAVGANPHAADAELSPSLMQGPSSVHLRFRLRDDLGTKVHYEVLETSDLSNWSVVPPTSLGGVTSGGGLPAGIKEYEYVLPTLTGSPRMMRLNIKRKP